jgi:hypothetical protein
MHRMTHGRDYFIGFSARDLVRDRFEPITVVVGKPAGQVCSVEDYFAINAKRVIEFAGVEAADARQRIIK